MPICKKSIFVSFSLLYEEVEDDKDLKEIVEDEEDIVVPSKTSKTPEAPTTDLNKVLRLLQILYDLCIHKRSDYKEDFICKKVTIKLNQQIEVKPLKLIPASNPMLFFCRTSFVWRVKRCQSGVTRSPPSVHFFYLLRLVTNTLLVRHLASQGPLHPLLASY